MYAVHVLLATILFSVGSLVCGQEQQWPSWLPEDAKDAMNEMNAAQKDGFMGDEVCRLRLEALKKLSMVANPQAGQMRAQVLLTLGFCDLRGESMSGSATMALRRFESAVSELNAPSEDALLQNLDMAPMVLLKQATKALKDLKLSEAGVALRRCKTIYGRQWDKSLKYVMKQNNIPEAGLAQVMDKIKTQPWAVQIGGFTDAVDAKLVQIDKYIIADKVQKEKKGRLDGKGGGSLAYFQALPMEASTEASRLNWVESLTDKFVVLAAEAESAGLEKHASLLKRTKDGSDCSKLPKLCEAVKEVSDIASNGFGETRLLVLKEKKQQKLDICETNGNIGVLIALKGAVTFVQGATKTQVDERSALAYDLCLEGSLAADADKTLVLVLQAWHPEIAALERTTFIREKSKSWKLDKDQEKAVTKIANDAAKKSWEKTLKQWRQGAAFGPELAEKIKAEEKSAAEAKQKEEEEKKKAETDADGNLKSAREDLAQKRAAKEADAQRKVAEKKQRVEEVRRKEAEAEPWRLDYRVLEAKEKLEALKEERRDANLKMEFDESTRLTKEVSKAERKYESAMDKAWKYHKKHGSIKTEKGEKKDKPDGSGAKGESASTAPVGGSKKDGSLKKQLEDLERRKQEASEAEDYKEAAKLKKEIKDLKAKMEL